MAEKIRRFVDTLLFKYLVPPFVQRRFSRTVLLYIFYGVISTLVDWTLFYAAGVWFGFGYVLSATVGFVFSSATNFATNKFLNFQNKSKQVGRQYVVHFTIALISLSLVYLFLYIFIDILGVPRMPAKMVTSFLLAFCNYFAHKHITFNTDRFPV